METFTDKLIKSLKPRESAFIVRENAPRGEGGFAIRVLPSGAKTWQIVYTFDGKRKWHSLGQYPFTGLSDARKKFRAARKLLEQGKDPGSETRAQALAAKKEKSINDLCDDFLAKYSSTQKRPNSAKEDRLNLKRDVRDKIGKRKVSDISRSDLQEIINSIVSRGAKVQAQRTLSTVRKMFNWAVEEEIIIESPALTVRAPKIKSAKIRQLSFGEIATLWGNINKEQSLPKAIGVILKLILLTGSRPSEAISIYKQNSETKWVMLTSDMTKNNKPHRVYLSGLAYKIKTSAEEDLTLSSDPNFVIKNYTLSAWVRKLNHLGLKDSWTPHDLRRTCATRLAELKTPPHIIKKILNHQERDITDEVYNLFAYSEEIALALDNLSKRIETDISKKSDDFRAL